MKAIGKVLAILALALSLPVAASAQAIKTYAVLPFAVNGPDSYRYLSQAVQSMLTSRLNWDGHLQSVDRSVIDKVKPAKAISLQVSEAKKILAGSGADYLVYGTVTIAGTSVNLDVNTLDKNGLTNNFPKQTDLNGLIPSLEETAKDLNAKVFNRQTAAARPVPGQVQAAPDAKGAVNKMNPELVFNETNANQEFYLNSEFRYAGSTETPGRWRSQGLSYAAIGAVSGDLDGDGKNEILVMSDRTLHVYRIVDQKLMPLGEYNCPLSFQCLNINLIDLDRDGVPEIVVSAMQGDDPKSFILSYKGGKFTVLAERIPMFLNVVRIPPDYRYYLIGQRHGGTRLFQPGVFMATLRGNELVAGSRIALPEKTNVFNFAYLPDKEGYKILVADDNDKLKTYNSKNELLATTEEAYAGSSLGIEYYDTIPGMGKPSNADGMSYMFYIPARLLPINLQQDKFEMITVHNVSVAAQFFSRYRSYAQGEIHALYWDGVGLNVFWKTKRIKGTIVDYSVEDVTNDGTKDLFVCVVSYPGIAGFDARKTYLFAYTLDTSNPDAAKKARIDDMGEGK